MGTWRPHVVFVILAIVIQSCIVYSQRVTKSSLTFVIDDSQSMTDEIDQVRDSVDSIFDTVMSSNQSQIKNFVLVSFNDGTKYEPDYIIHAVTENRKKFKAAAARVHIRDGVPECPEQAMLGIKIGIQNSLPMSTLYVFTDASAKDYDMYDEIKAMAQRKQIQVTFMLTGDCGSRGNEDYQVYHQLAKVTNGEVFNLMKRDIKDILKYVRENTKSRGNFIASKSFPPGYGFQFNFTVDSRTKEFTMSIAGLNPKLEIIDPNGNVANTEPIVEKDEILIVKVTNTTPGVYKANVGSKTGTLAKVTGQSDIHFEYGFSKLEPTSLSVTATRPEADGKSYLSIQLFGDGVKFKTAKILDLNDIVLKELPLRLLDNKTNFYATEQFEPPKTTFRIFVYGYDDDNKMDLNRSVGSPTDPRDPTVYYAFQIRTGSIFRHIGPLSVKRHLKKKVEDVAPEVTIIEGNKVILDYDSTLRVTCKVHAYPPPEITWQDKDTGEIIQTSVTEVAPPYDFISTLNIEKLNRNGTYNCTAKNSLGKNGSQIVVEANIYFNVLETPKNTTSIEFDKEGKVSCVVNASPPVTTIWYKDGRQLSNDTNVVIADGNTTLSIKHMDLESVGTYVCEVRNVLQRQVFHSEVEVFGLEKPVIDATEDEIYVLKGDNIELVCRITQGVPKPTIEWYYQPQAGDSVQTLAETSDTLQLKPVTADSNGKYTCNATNLVGSDTFTIEVIVEYAPTIQRDGSNTLQPEQGDAVTIPCDVDGVPPPIVKWFRNGTLLNSTVDINTTSSNSLKFHAIAVSDSGLYKCLAENQHGSANKTVSVDVTVGPQIEAVTETNIIRVLDQWLVLKCLVHGNPRPDIEWIHTDFDGETMPTKLLYGDHNQYLFTENVRLNDKGYYTCVASNIGGSANITYKVNVYAKPIIRKIDYEKRVTKGENVQLSCRVSQGNPKPTIQWYFQSEDSRYFLNETGENLQLRSITADKSGTYQCNASNVEGFDLQIIELTVEYPPTIKDDGNKTIIANQYDIIIIPCDVAGIPTPFVKWFKNGKQLYNTRQTAIMGNHSLRIIAMSVSSIDNYSCMAENHLGSKNKTVFVDVYVKPSIDVPQNTTIEKNVGEYLILPCRADGYPIPNIKWIYYNDVTGEKEKKLLKHDKMAMVMGLDNVRVKDSGYYICEARNDAGPSYLKYTVIVNAPPVIVNVYPEKTIKTVKGDLVLRVPCEVTGSPKPTVTWIKDSFNVALGTLKYDIDNGTLIIMKTDKESAGNYVCVAENKAGKANVSYDVIVTDYPELDTPVSTKFIEQGQNANIACDIPHNKFNLLRWFKDGNLINKGELTLHNPQLRDNGVYSCRVSNFTKSSSAHVNITVGYKPFFTSDEKLYHEFVKDDSLGLRCSAEGSPIPKVHWWLNGEKLNETSTSYELIMRLDNRGNYTCEISNELGRVQRSFTVAAKGCILDAKNDFLDEKQPLMLSSSLMWPIFDVTEGYMFLNKDDTFKLHCPTGFENFHTQFIEARCEKETDVKINGKVYKYAEIKCKAEVEPTAQIFRGGCWAGHNATYIQVGYEADGRFFKVYDVCLDNEDEVPLYTRHIINRAQYGITKNVNRWFGHDALPLDFDTIYDCVTQVEDISATLGKPFHQNDKCCYDKRQLVNSEDLRPGIPPAVAYSYLNVVPHWSTCNSKNWADVEQKVRELVQSRDSQLIITTGTAKTRRISSSVHSSNIMLHDKRGRTQPIAQYLWKVVQDPVTKSSLAIIQINVPDISTADARKYVHCRDICNSVGWMDSSNWHNVRDGYTFCCSILEFESMFHYDGQFNGNMITVLTDWRSDYDYS